jgi:tRNA A37 threonylcarbamoyltransferase TsaD
VPDTYIFDLAKKGYHGAQLIEALAAFGDSSLVDKMPIPKLWDMTLSMSYAGVETWFKH